MDQQSIHNRVIKLKVPQNTIFDDIMPTYAIKSEIEIILDEHSYEPKVKNPKYDWVASVAIPAMLAFNQKLIKEGRKVKEFCTIGTGTGTDALAAMEIFRPRKMVVTDLHPSVVNQAVENIRSNLLHAEEVVVVGETGDLCSPLIELGYKFDLIYENLPNIPVSLQIDLLSGQNTSSFYAPSYQDSPESVKQDLLELHYAFLMQAKSALNDEGRVLSSIGCRRPLAAILDMFQKAGYQAEVLIYTWKMQSEAEEVISGYVRQQHINPEHPFYFYTAATLENAFDDLSPFIAAGRAFEIENLLQPYALDAQRALTMVREGIPIGHVTTVIEARPI
jgi:methylase of polypeptide subunit release factors